MKNLIFDFDGTIADSYEVMVDALFEMAKKIGIEGISKENIEEFRNTPTRELLKTFKIPIYKVPGLVRKFSESHKIKYDDVELVDGMKEVLGKIKESGIHMGILTSNTKETVEMFLKMHELEMFEFVYSQESVFKKSSTLKKILKTYKYSKDETIYIGDETRDIEASRKAGVSVGSVLWGLNGEKIIREYRPDYIFSHPKDILEIIKK